MKFGLRVPLLRDPASRDPFHQTYTLCQAAEKAGFDFVSLTHHSFTPDCQTSAPFVILAAIAARTTTLRLSTIVYLLPLYHPVAVAEQVATLDMISNGRAILGIGLGYRDYEFEGFGLSLRDRGARTEESVSAIRHAWQTGRFNYSGKHFQIPDLPAVPMPVQKPRPPIWFGGTVEPAIKRAARLGDGWIATNMEYLEHELVTANKYRAFCKAEGTEPFVCVVRNGWVAATREEVERDWYGSVIDFHLGYRKAGFETPDVRGVYKRLEAGEKVPLNEFSEDLAIAGTPVDCIAQLTRWRDRFGAQAMMILLNEDAGFEKLKKTIEMFGREVFPAING